MIIDNSEAENRVIVQDIFNYFQQERQEWKGLGNYPQDLKKRISRTMIEFKEQVERYYYFTFEPNSMKFIFCSYCPIELPTSKVLSMAEFVTQVNCDLKFGHFELVNFGDRDEDGSNLCQIRHKSSIEYISGSLNRALIRNLVNNSVSAVDKYMPAIFAVIEEDVAPREAACWLAPEVQLPAQAPSQEEASICSQCLLQLRDHIFQQTHDGDLWLVQGLTGAMLEMSYKELNREFSCKIRVEDRGQELLCYSIYPITVPQSKRLAVAELIVFGLDTISDTFGNYELNWDNGELRYKTSIDFHGGEFNPLLAANALYYNASWMDEYMPLFQLVIEEDMSPVEALDLFFGGSDEENDL